MRVSERPLIADRFAVQPHARANLSELQPTRFTLYECQELCLRDAPCYAIDYHAIDATCYISRACVERDVIIFTNNFYLFYFTFQLQ